MRYSFWKFVKVQIKVSLPWYVVIVMGLFAILYPLIYGVDTYSTISAVLESAFSFLAVFIFANTYYIEIQQGTEEIFCLLPKKSRKREIGRRIGIRMSFAILAYMLSYFMFTFQNIYLPVDEVLSIVIVEGLFAVTANIVLFGGISCFFVNLFNNMWKGVGVGILIWFILTSVWGRQLPDLINVFNYGEEGRNWVLGKISGMLIGSTLFLLSANLTEDGLFGCRGEKE